MPYYIPKRKMFISKANPDDKRELFFPGLISVAVETKKRNA